MNKVITKCKKGTVEKEHKNVTLDFKLFLSEGIAKQKLVKLLLTVIYL